MNADDARKDELAARALSRLGEPAIPEGLAARIAARAAAMPQITARAAESPQIDAARPAEAPTGTPAPAPAPPVSRFTLARRPLPDRRRHIVAASIAAALLVSVGVYASLRDREDKISPLAKDEPTQAPPRADRPAAPRLADAAPPAKASGAEPPRREGTRSAHPAMTSPVPPPPVELVVEEAPPAAAPPKESPAEENRLAQTGPSNAPNTGLRPVYGPPAPVGLGIAGGTGGASLPGETSGGKRGPDGGSAPPGGPPPEMPGPGGPRGPGPRM